MGLKWMKLPDDPLHSFGICKTMWITLIHSLEVLRNVFIAEYKGKYLWNQSLDYNSWYCVVLNKAFSCIASYVYGQKKLSTFLKMGNRQPSEHDPEPKPETTTSQIGSTMSIPLLRSFFGEAPPTPKQNHIDLTVQKRWVQNFKLKSWWK